MPGQGIHTWQIRTYQWNEEQDQAIEIRNGATDVLGTHHDIPPVALCRQCHDAGGKLDLVLGFDPIQLNHEDTPLSLEDLDAMGLLSNTVPTATAVIPTSDTVTREALGYLHANCGHCHGGSTPQAGMILEVIVGLPRIEDTGVYQTAIGMDSTWMMDGATLRIAPNDPDASTLYRRMGIRDGADNQMPPLATDMVDSVGHQAIAEWIRSLPADP